MLTVRLFNGRLDFDEAPRDWGRPGPTLGPLTGALWTHGALRLDVAGGDEPIELALLDGLLFYDGLLYADAELSTQLEPTAQVDEALTHPPAQWLVRRAPVPLSGDDAERWRASVAVFTDAVRSSLGDELAARVARRLEAEVTARRDSRACI